MKLQRIVAPVFLGVFILVLSAACKGGGDSANSGSVVKEFEEKIVFTPDQQKFLLEAARKGLAGQAMPQPDVSLDAIDGAGAVVEAFLPPNKPVITTIGGGPFMKSFELAVKKTADNSGFVSAMKGNLDKVRIKVGVITRVKSLKFKKSDKDEGIFRHISQRVEDGLDGFILVIGKKAAYQIPDLVAYNGWGLRIEVQNEQKKRVAGRNLVARQLKALSREASGNADSWKTGSLYSFRTFSFIDKFGQPGAPVESYRSKDMIPPLSTESLRAATIANADYLARIVDDKGQFVYVYYPNENQNDPTYGIVRHAGAVFGLFEAYNTFGDKKYYDAGRRALDYILKITEMPKEAPDIAIVQERGSSVLGTNALAAMALAVLPKEFMADKEKELRDKLGASILYFQMPKKGWFYTSYQQALTKKPPSKQAAYFPGESMLALVRLFENTGDKKWWNAAAEVSPGQKELWTSDGPNAVGNYCWVGQAWARMARIEKDPKMREEYKSLAYSHGDAVIKHQWAPDRKGYYPDYLGGADNSRPPRTTPTSARGESLAEIYLTAKFLGDVEAQKKYGVALLQAIHFFVQNQFTDENSWYLPHPEKAKGGIRGALIANDIRIDYNQHALTTEINTLGVPEDLKALGVTIW